MGTEAGLFAIRADRDYVLEVCYLCDLLIYSWMTPVWWLIFLHALCLESVFILMPSGGGEICRTTAALEVYKSE